MVVIVRIIVRYSSNVYSLGPRIECIREVSLNIQCNKKITVLKLTKLCHVCMLSLLIFVRDLMVIQVVHAECVLTWS